MALLLFCITSIRAPTMPAVGAGVGGPDSGLSGTCLDMLRESLFTEGMLTKGYDRKQT